MTTIRDRAQGALLGQVAGDSLGGLVEFLNAEQILQQYPAGVRVLAAGGVWNTLAGQPTDDSEMALLLARSLAQFQEYRVDEVARQYRYWKESGPFDCGATIRAALNGTPDAESQANGALMRISPLGVWGVHRDPADLAIWARADAALTHPHRICQEANALFVHSIASAIRTGDSPAELHAQALAAAKQWKVCPELKEDLAAAANTPPADYITQAGWVRIAFQNAYYQLLHAPSLEEGVVATVMQGGDTDTNAAIAGALLGAVYGREAIPLQWQESVLQCQPQSGRAGIHRPRPRCFWPTDVLEIADQLVG